MYLDLWLIFSPNKILHNGDFALLSQGTPDMPTFQQAMNSAEKEK
jgi:hypothetical protein